MYRHSGGCVLNMSQRSACIIDETFFSGKKQKFSLGSACLKSWIVRISELLGLRLKEFHCICKAYMYCGFLTNFTARNM
jgi:hypothetical protein